MIDGKVENPSVKFKECGYSRSVLLFCVRARNFPDLWGGSIHHCTDYSPIVFHSAGLVRRPMISTGADASEKFTCTPVLVSFGIV